MVKANAAEFHTVLPFYHTREDVYACLAPWTQEPPPASSGSAPAEDLHLNLAATRDRLDEIFSLWSEFRDYYGGADRDQVLTSMNDLVGQAMALEEGGALLAQAHATYVSEADSRGLAQVKSDNDSWAPGFVERYQQFEADDASMSREEFEEKYGHDVGAERAELDKERKPFTTMASHVTQAIGEARDTYEASVNGIDLGELSDLRFENRNEAVDVADSQEEVEQWIRDSEFFNEYDLTPAQIEDLAEQIYQNGNFDAEYFDAEGRGWVRGPDGRMVRAGSVMDPNLTEALFEAMARDDTMKDWELPIPPPEGVDPVDWTIGTVFGQGTSAASDALGKGLDVAGRRWVAGLLMGPAAMVSFGFKGKDAVETRERETVLYPLMSPGDLDQRYNHNLLMAAIETGANTAVGGGLTFFSALSAVPSGGSSVVVAVIVDEITGRIIGYMVDELDESMTTWDADEVNELSDKELHG